MDGHPELWWQDVTTNLLGSALCSMAVLPHMMKRRRGIIINMDGGGGGCGPDIVIHRIGGRKAQSARLSGPTSGARRMVARRRRWCGSLKGYPRTESGRFAGDGIWHESRFCPFADDGKLIASKTGKKWQGFVNELFGHQAERPPSDCAAAAIKLLQIASPEINGCIFDVDTDFRAVARQKSRIAKQALLQLMRLRDPRVM